MTTGSATVAQQATSNGNKTRVIVISDLHLGSKAMKSGGMFNNLCRFLSEIISNDDLNIQRLILLGMLIITSLTNR
jgi:metallophosphoesterase superfamily enzyme